MFTQLLEAAMNARGCSRIPRELFYWITFLTKVLPLRSVGTFIELLIGAMLTPQGFVTEAYLLLDMKNHWTSYYKWLQQGRWSWLALARQFARLVLRLNTAPVMHLIIDDTLTLRASKKAPGSQIHHQHGNKPNLARYVRGQCWVSLAAVIEQGARSVAVPLLSRLIPSASNTGKLVAANTLMRALGPLFSGRKIRLLLDSWYMRKVLIQRQCAQGVHVIGQVRIDTRLYDEPPTLSAKRRGRPRKYGRQYTVKRIAHMKKTEVKLTVYSKEQAVRYRSKIVKARFLDGQRVRAVWVELQDNQGQWRKSILLLSTDTSLSAEQVIESYGLRWSIEPMFKQLKQAWGLKEAWQQTRQTLHRWVQLTMTGYGLIQLLACYAPSSAESLCQATPWRRHSPVTAGTIRIELVHHFRHVAVRRWWDKKCKKFWPPDKVNQPAQWPDWLKAS
jgi:hypothetical protein